MTKIDFEPLSVNVPLWEDPPGVFRVGNSRVLLELVLDAFKSRREPRSHRSVLSGDSIGGRVRGHQSLPGKPGSL